MPIAAIYARVSSDKQREEGTIASQTAALIDFARSRGYQVPTEWVFEDEGYSGASLVRPGLERVRDLAAEGQIEAVLVHAPDRLSRKYAYQILLIEEPRAPWCRYRLPEGTPGSDRGGPAAGAIPRHDRGIRASTDP